MNIPTIKNSTHTSGTKKYIIAMLCIGIVFCSSVEISARPDVNSSSHAPFLDQLIWPGVTGAILTNIAVSEGMSAWHKSKEYGGSFISYLLSIKPELYCLTNEELKQKINSSKYLPKAIKEKLDKEDVGGTGFHKFMLLYGESGTGKSRSAKKIALENNGNYYHVHNKNLIGYSDRTIEKFLFQYLKEISDETDDNSVSTLHLEEFGQRFKYSEKSESANIWKDFLEKVENHFPKVRLIACTNYGTKPGEAFDAAIAERAHMIKLDKPSMAARADYLNHGYADYLQKTSKEHTIHQTKNCKTQNARNNVMKENFYVTDEMINQAKKEHKSKIDASKIPWTWQIMLNPFSWNKTMKANRTAQKLESQGYYVEAITSNKKIMPTEKYKERYIAATQDLRFRQLEEITEQARIDKLNQIGNIKKRLKNQKEDSKIQHRISDRCYITTHTYSQIIHHDNESGQTLNIPTTNTTQKTYHYHFGEILPINIVLAAERVANKKLIDARDKMLEQESLDEALQSLKNETSDINKKLLKEELLAYQAINNLNSKIQDKITINDRYLYSQAVSAADKIKNLYRSKKYSLVPYQPNNYLQHVPNNNLVTNEELQEID